MKKLLFSSLCLVTALCLCGCYQPANPRVNLQSDIRSDSLDSNMITKPIGAAVSAILGEGIEICEVRTFRNDAGYMELQLTGYNRSVSKKDFEYRIDWLDCQGMYIDSVTNSWTRTSAMPKSEFRICGVAPRKDAVDYRINTRKK